MRQREIWRYCTGGYYGGRSQSQIKECGRHLETGKGEGTGSPFGPQEGMETHWHLNLSQWDSFQIELWWDNKVELFYFANKGPSSQSYGFSSSHLWMWELDYKESWVLKNWCFWTVVLEKTLESPLDCKEIQSVHPQGDQSWVFIGRTDVEAETPILWPLDAKNWLIGKDPNARKDWR